MRALGLFGMTDAPVCGSRDSGRRTSLQPAREVGRRDRRTRAGSEAGKGRGHMGYGEMSGTADSRIKRLSAIRRPVSNMATLR